MNELIVLHNCLSFENAVNDPSENKPDPSKIQIPHEAEGYYVFGRILANSKKTAKIAKVKLVQLNLSYIYILNQACNKSGDIGELF